MKVEFDFAHNGEKGGWCHVCDTGKHKFTLDLTKDDDNSCWRCSPSSTNIYICEDCLEEMYQFFHSERNKHE